jgi:hypothetical protein
MVDYKEHIKDINKDYVASYFASYMNSVYQIVVGYEPVSMSIVNMQKTLAEWQLNNDCCSLCMSSMSIPGTIESYARLPQTPDHCSPFQPLHSGGHFKFCTI